MFRRLLNILKVLKNLPELDFKVSGHHWRICVLEHLEDERFRSAKQKRKKICKKP